MLVSFLLMASLLASTSLAAIPGNIRYKTKPSAEDAPHMAYLLTATRVNYPNRVAAEEDLKGIRENRLSFLEALRKQQEFNKRHSRNREGHYSGDLGLLSYDQLEQDTSNVLFDIRNPTAGATANSIIGPICDDYGCSLYIVYQRFRRSFFTPSWLEADEFCINNDIDFGQFLQGLGNNDNRALASRIWPDDIATFQRIKLNQVQGDLKRMKDGDPSTVMPKRKPRNLSVIEAHQKRIAEREVFFGLVVGKELTKSHPEVYSMELPELANSGLIPRELLIEKGLGAYLNNHNDLGSNESESVVEEKEQASSNVAEEEGKCGGDCPIDVGKIRAQAIPIQEVAKAVQEDFDDLDEF